MLRPLLISGLLLAGTASPSMAQAEGRYDIVVAPSNLNRGENDALLLDRQTGRTWILGVQFGNDGKPRGQVWVPLTFGNPPDNKLSLTPTN